MHLLNGRGVRIWFFPEHNQEKERKSESKKENREGKRKTVTTSFGLTRKYDAEVNSIAMQKGMALQGSIVFNT